MNYLTVSLALQLIIPISSSKRNIFNPNGPEYEGHSGAFNYAIFASVGVTHSKALELCSIYYPDGRLAWLGDTKVKSVRAIIDQSLAFHYMNANNFFWIDGYSLDPNCKPQLSSCRWSASKSSLVERDSTRSFVNNNVVYHKPLEKPINASIEDVTYWPVLLPNANEEFTVPEAFILSAAPGYMEAGFICAYRSEVDMCPFGFTSMATLAVPNYLSPRKVRLEDMCIRYH